MVLPIPPALLVISAILPLNAFGFAFVEALLQATSIQY
jgi:hypothetical protein